MCNDDLYQSYTHMPICWTYPLDVWKREECTSTRQRSGVGWVEIRGATNQIFGGGDRGWSSSIRWCTDYSVFAGPLAMGRYCVMRDILLVVEVLSHGVNDPFPQFSSVWLRCRAQRCNMQGSMANHRESSIDVWRSVSQTATVRLESGFVERTTVFSERKIKLAVKTLS